MANLSFERFVAPDRVPRLTREQCRMSFEQYPEFLDRLLGIWGPLSKQPFKGVTTDGNAVPGLFSLRDDGAPVAAAAQAATLWLRQVPPEMLSVVSFPVNSDVWRFWQNTPLLLRPGEIELGDMPLPLRELALEVVRCSLSSAGYDRTRRIMANNLLLGQLNALTEILNNWAFTFSIFGTPSTEAPWGWQLFGHHLALNCLFIGGQMVLSPVFMGAEPDVGTGPEMRRLFEDHEKRALAMFDSLSEQEQAEATLYSSMLTADQPVGRYHPDDGRTVGGAFQDNRVVRYEGLSGADLAIDQRRKLLNLAEVFIQNMPDGPAEARLREIERHFDQTYFAWIGKANEVDPFYFRLHSPVALIEFDHHSGIFLANEEPERFHIHTIVRTPNGGDFGFDLLRQHYASGNHGEGAHGHESNQHAHLHSHDGGKTHHSHD